MTRSDRIQIRIRTRVSTRTKNIIKIRKKTKIKIRTRISSGSEEEREITSGSESNPASKGSETSVLKVLALILDGGVRKDIQHKNFYIIKTCNRKLVSILNWSEPNRMSEETVGGRQR